MCEEQEEEGPSSLNHGEQEGQWQGKRLRVKPKNAITYSFEGYGMTSDFKHNRKLLDILKQGCHVSICVL